MRLRRADGTEVPAEVATADPANDLALLKADVKLLLPALPLASFQARPGQRAFTIGYPHPDIMGSGAKVTDGIINAASGVANDPRLLQISVAVQAGSSGGPLLNMQGEVVGVVCAKLDALSVWAATGDLPENVGYAVKADYLKALLSSVGVNVSQIGALQPNAAGMYDAAALAAVVEMGEILQSGAGATLEDLAARIRPSVMLVIAE